MTNRSLAEAAAGLPKTLTLREAAAFCRCSTRTLRRAIRCGRLSAGKLHPAAQGHVLVARDELILLLESGVAR